MSYTVPAAGQAWEPMSRAWRQLFGDTIPYHDVTNFDGLFFKTYNVKIHRVDVNVLSSLEFESEGHYMLFLMEWS
jgi:hypothetical protein